MGVAGEGESIVLEDEAESRRNRGGVVGDGEDDELELVPE